MFPDVTRFLWPSKDMFGGVRQNYAALAAYYVVGMSVMLILNHILDSYVTEEGKLLKPGMDASSLVWVLLFSLFALIFNFGIMHGVARLFKGKGRPKDTLTVVSLGATPIILLGWFPCLGQLAYLLVLANYFEGVKEKHKLSAAKSAVAVFAPLFALFLIIAIILFYISFSESIVG